MISFKSIRFWWHAKRAEYRYSRSFRKMDDARLSAVVKHERNLRAWCSQRSYYLAALRKECNRRGIAYIQ
jgi:hypothetical protein